MITYPEIYIYRHACTAECEASSSLLSQIPMNLSVTRVAVATTIGYTPCAQGVLGQANRPGFSKCCLCVCIQP